MPGAHFSLYDTGNGRARRQSNYHGEQIETALEETKKTIDALLETGEVERGEMSAVKRGERVMPRAGDSPRRRVGSAKPAAAVPEREEEPQRKLPQAKRQVNPANNKNAPHRHSSGNPCFFYVPGGIACLGKGGGGGGQKWPRLAMSSASFVLRGFGSHWIARKRRF